jgi:hypothetical protein
MKFATHTKMMTASYRDIEMAGAQGTITRAQVGSHQFGRSETDQTGDPKKVKLIWAAFIGCMVFFSYSVFLLWKTKTNAEGLLSEPLVASSGVSA